MSTEPAAGHAPDLWPKVLDGLAEVGGAVGGVLFTGSHERVLRWTASEVLAQPTAEFADSDLIRTSQRLGRVLGVQHQGFVGDLDIYREDELGDDPIYRDFLWPRGLGWAAGTGVTMPTGDALVLSLERARVAGPPDAETIGRLDVLRPHVARSAFLAARQNLEQARTATETLALIGLPAMVMDATAKVLAANSLTNNLKNHVLWKAAHRVVLMDPAANTALQHALATIDTDQGGAVRSFAIRDAGRIPAMVAHVLR